MFTHLIAFSAAVATGAADEDCVGYYFKINGVCTGVQQFANAQGCGPANGGIASHPLAVDKAFCMEFGTARVPADQQIPMVSWGNLGKPGAATFAGEVNDPTMPSGCVAHANQNTYQWNNALNGATNGWWRLICMTNEMPAPSPPPSMPPTEPRTMTKCKTYTPDVGMSIKNGADSEAVQLCKVINGNAISPMWGNGKDSDCGTDAGLIAASTNSIADCQALCDAHVDCLGWWMWDQLLLPAPSTRDDQGCYLFGSGTSDQLVPDRPFDSAVAAGVCFPEPRTMTKCKTYTPDRAMSIKNGADSVAVQLCKVINGNVMTPMWDNGKASDCGTDAGLIAASTNSIMDCQALCDAHVDCLGWQLWDQTILPAPFTRDDQGCYLFESGTADQLVPDRVFDSAIAAGVCFPETPVVPTSPPTVPPTDAPADCKKVTLKSGDKCLHTQGPNATSMWMTCPAPGTNDPLFQFDIIAVDPTDPNSLVKIQNSAGQYVSYQAPWQDAAMTRNWSSQYVQTWERRITSSGVQFYNAGRAAFLASNPAVNSGFAGFTTTDSATESTFELSSAGICGSAPTAPPTEPPTTCDCRQTDATYDQGARCMGPLGESIGYRKTANWCCSDYGCSKGYKWVNPADNQCHDDTFVGTCMFNFIGAGGCNVSQTGNDDAIMAAVDPACFDCPHIGDMVDQECMGSSQPGPIKILNDMIDDARRLDAAPLPAGDDKLQKINRKISKIRTLLRQKKLDSQAALNGSG